jgi:uridine kinase
MIVKAFEELNIDLNNSWLIGDSTADMLAAKNMDIKSILVETGHAGLDEKYWVLPDFIVPDIDSGVNFILHTYPKYLNFCSKYSEEVKFGDFIFVGGLSRSGKSTFASVLKYALQLNGKKAHILSLDRWLKSESNRTIGITGRYDIDEFQKFIENVWINRNNEQILNLPGYNKIKKQKVDSVELLNYSKGDILIIEGTIALNLEASKLFYSKNYFITINEDVRKDRVIKEYLMRGDSLENAIQIYNDRQIDESPIIVKSKSNSIQIDSTQFY